jgi:hypothetical protein
MGGMRQYLVFGTDVSEEQLAAQCVRHGVRADCFAIGTSHHGLFVHQDDREKLRGNLLLTQTLIPSSVIDQIDPDNVEGRFCELLSNDFPSACLYVAVSDYSNASAAAIFQQGKLKSLHVAAEDRVSSLKDGDLALEPEPADYRTVANNVIRHFLEEDEKFDHAIDRLDEAWEMGHVIGAEPMR